MRATIVLCATFLLARACRGRSAAVRHMVYLAAFIVLLIVPLASAVMPPITLRPPLTAIAAQADSPVVQTLFEPAVEAPAALATNGSRAESPFRVPALSIRQALSALWLLGMLLCLTPAVVGTWQLARLRRHASSCAHGQEVIDRLTRARRLRRTVTVLQASDANGFFSFGWLRPVILVPVDAASWPADALRRALLHELEHVRRFDWATLLLSRLVCAFYWFHPLVWLANRRLHLQAEHACDDAAVTGEDPVAYASLLVAVAERPLPAATPLLAIASPGDLSHRVRAVLDRSRSRNSVGRWSIVTAIAISAIVAFALSPRVVLRAAAIPQAAASPGDPSTARPAFDVASIKPSRATRPRVVVQAGHYAADGMSLRDLMRGVFQVHPTQLVNGPEWMDSARFTINARTEHPPVGNLVGTKPLVRTLLEDRFGLRTHLDMREMDALVLVRARPDAPLPPGIQPTQSSCGTQEERRAHTRRDWPPCEAMRVVNVPGEGTKGETTNMRVSAYTMDQFAGYVGAILDSPAVNQTGLNGRYDLEFSYVRPLPDASIGDRLPDGPRLQVAVEEQLGLRVERRRVSVPVVVIDAVTRPSPD